MASHMDHLLLLFFLLISSSLQSQARESHFFNKVTRSEANSPKAATPVAEKPVTVTLPPQSVNGYGLYGRDSNDFPTTTTTTTTGTNYNYNNNNNVARRDPTNTPASFSSNAEFPSDGYEKKESNANSIPSNFRNEEFGHGSYETKEPNYSYNNKGYGMSDTRFVENGKYFYDANSEGYGKEYDEQTKANPDQGYGSYSNLGSRNVDNGGYSYGTGDRNGYEYQNNQENQERQEDYVP